MIKKISFLCLVALSTIACKKDFEEINTNPNAPTAVEPEFLLRQVSYDLGEQMSYEGFVAGNLLSQHFAMVDFNLFDRHSLSEPQLGGNPWPVLYSNLRDNETLLNLANSNSVYRVYQGPAMVLKAYIAMALTDIYGDVPYFQAVKAKEGIINPSYSSQEDIYLQDGGILDLLQKAESNMTNYQGGLPLNGDIIYGGDLSSWIKFANSLRIKALMRISGRLDVSAELQDIVDNGNYIKVASENATYQFTDGRPNNFRMANLRDGDFNSFTMSQTAEEIFAAFNDSNRVKTFYRTTNPSSTVYNGTLNGRNASDAISLDTISLPGIIFRENPGVLEANFITSWETAFFLAEGAEKGIISGSAKNFYEQGVTDCFTYWKTDIPSDYLSQGPALYGASNPLEQILTQKWMGNFINGYEAWVEYRRTGFPALKTVGASLNNNQFPVRMPYPTDEQALNSSNYNVAANNTDGNSVNFPVWWDN